MTNLPSQEVIQDNTSFLEFLDIVRARSTKEELELIIVAWWFVWYNSNGVVFREEACTASKVSHMICAYMDTLRSLKRVTEVVGVGSEAGRHVVPSRSSSRQRAVTSWIKPPEGFVKLYFDGSKLDNGQAAFGFIIRDHGGSVKLCGAGALASSATIIVAEARGLYEGIRGALSLGVRKISIEGDNLSVIQALRKSWKIPWSIHAIISDSLEDLKQFEEFRISHVYREGNAAADWLASKGHSTENLTYWLIFLITLSL